MKVVNTQVENSIVNNKKEGTLVPSFVLFELKQGICYPGFEARACEDAIGYGKNYCFVLDGASCLSGKNIVDPVSDSAWMAGKLRDGLCALLDQAGPRPTRQLLRQVVAQVREEYVQALQSAGSEAPEDSPSAAFALFRQRDDKLEFFGIGDCVGVAKLPDGRDFHARDNILPKLDSQVLKQMKQLHLRTGASMTEAKKACNDLLIQNRCLRNKPEGYWILDLVTDDGICNAREEAWELTEPVCVGAFSDGFSQLTDVFGHYGNYTAVFDAMRENNLEEMFQTLCALQNADPACNAYPRFKHRDDTSALWGVFRPEKQ